MEKLTGITQFTLSNMEFIIYTYTSLGFADTFRSLEVDRKNWFIFKNWLMIAMKYAEIWGHFNGSANKPIMLETSSKLKSTYKEELAAWQMNEDLARYVLTMKIPKPILRKCVRKSTAAEIWASVVDAFTTKKETPSKKVVDIALSSKWPGTRAAYSYKFSPPDMNANALENIIVASWPTIIMGDLTKG